MKLAVLTYYTTQRGDQAVADLTIPTRDRYCARHGYDHVIAVAPHDPAIYYATKRIRFLRALLDAQPNFDVVWVLNVHALVMTHAIPVDRYLDPAHDFFICRDGNGLNAGSFLVRNTAWAREWLDFVYEHALGVSHVWHEQLVMMEHAGDAGFVERIQVLPHPSINSYLPSAPLAEPAQAFAPGHLVLHLPGAPLDVRVATLGSMLETVQA